MLNEHLYLLLELLLLLPVQQLVHIHILERRLQLAIRHHGGPPAADSICNLLRRQQSVTSRTLQVVLLLHSFLGGVIGVGTPLLNAPGLLARVLQQQQALVLLGGPLLDVDPVVVLEVAPHEQVQLLVLDVLEHVGLLHLPRAYYLFLLVKYSKLLPIILLFFLLLRVIMIF